MSAMVKIYVSLIINGKRKFSSIPASLKPNVREVLISMGRQDLIDE